MKRLHVLTACLLTVLLLVGAAQASSTPLFYAKGDKIQDFSFTTYDGESYCLYDILKEKDAILLNIWATWCGPCRNEFPYMQEAYAEYQDKIEVIALSCEPTDTPEKLAAFAKQYGLTFKIGQDPVDFLRALGMTSIPTTLMIDRFGTICFIEAGAQTSADSFRRLFDVFLGDDYTESILLDAIPSIKPNVASSEQTALTEALGSTAKNPTNAYTWPMIVTEKDGRMVVASTNAKYASTRAEVTATVKAKAGDAIVVTFKTSTEPIYDLLTLSLNGRTVKSFGGEHDWMTYAMPVESDGEHQVKVSYIKDVISDAGEDTVWVDSIVVAEDAAAALAANPAYPIAEKNDIIVTTPVAQEVTIADPNGLLAANFGNVKCYIVNSDTASVKGSLAESVDPEKAFLYFSFDKTQLGMLQAMSEDGYTGNTGVDSMNTTNYLCSYAVLYLDATGNNRLTGILFRDEENLNSFVSRNALGEWHYVEETIDESAAKELPLNSMSAYTLRCVDQNGNPVSGVMMQVCDDETCQVLMTDGNGVCTFTAAPYAWEIHILRAPDGYTVDSTEVVHAPAAGGEIVFTLTAN